MSHQPVVGLPGEFVSIKSGVKINAIATVKTVFLSMLKFCYNSSTTAYASLLLMMCFLPDYLL